MSHRAVAPLVAAALALAGCSSDADSQPTTVSSTSASSSTSSTTFVATSSTTSSTTTEAPSTTLAPTTIAAATTTAAPTTTVAPVPPTTPAPTTAPTTCPSLAALPAGAIETAVEVIDVDADGLADTVRSYAVASPPGAGDWHLRAELAAGGGSDLALPFDPAPAGVTVLGGAYIGSNVDPGPGGARPAIFATVGAGASASIIGLFRMSGCNLVAMPDAASAAAAQFPVGATVMHSDDLRCDGVAGTSLLVHTATTYDDVAMVHHIVETPYTRSGDELVPYASPVVSSSPTLPTGGGLGTCGISLP